MCCFLWLGAHGCRRLWRASLWSLLGEGNRTLHLCTCSLDDEQRHGASMRGGEGRANKTGDTCLPAVVKSCTHTSTRLLLILQSMAVWGNRLGRRRLVLKRHLCGHTRGVEARACCLRLERGKVLLKLASRRQDEACRR